MTQNRTLLSRPLGQAGPVVGAIGFGAMGMSWAYADPHPDPDRYSLVLHQAVDATLIDTADLYGPFTNEDIIGRTLAARREQVVLATKAGLHTTDPAVHTVLRNGRPDHLRSALRASLRRLRTDRLDLHYLHRVDDQVPLSDQWGPSPNQSPPATCWM